MKLLAKLPGLVVLFVLFCELSNNCWTETTVWLSSPEMPLSKTKEKSQSEIIDDIDNDDLKKSNGDWGYLQN